MMNITQALLQDLQLLPFWKHNFLTTISYTCNTNPVFNGSQAMEDGQIYAMFGELSAVNRSRDIA